MARLDIRCNVQVPVTLMPVRRWGNSPQQALTRDMGIYGAFLKAPLSLPVDALINLKAHLPYAPVETEGRVLRREEAGLAVKFTRLDRRAKSLLWDYIKEKIPHWERCPFCGAENPPGVDYCGGCGLFINFHIDNYLEIHEREVISRQSRRLESALERFNERMEEIERRLLGGEGEEQELLKEVSSAIYEVCDVCRDLDEVVGEERESLKEKKLMLRERTERFFSKSYFMRHARSWPRGYPGDYKMLENIYRNIPLSDGIGYLLDLHFLNTALAVGVRERLATLRELLRRELEVRQKPTILDVACGPCREIFELAPEIAQSEARITCVDFDSEALDFAYNRISYTKVAPQVQFRKYNALRMVNHEKNLKEFGPQDIIFSTGLFDYLTDDLLVKLIRALYQLLKPGGKLICSFKDSTMYKTQEYHWFVDWDSFFQRTAEQSRSLLIEAGIDDELIKTTRERTGVIIFYIAEKP